MVLVVVVVVVVVGGGGGGDGKSNIIFKATGEKIKGRDRLLKTEPGCTGAGAGYGGNPEEPSQATCS